MFLFIHTSNSCHTQLHEICSKKRKNTRRGIKTLLEACFPGNWNASTDGTYNYRFPHWFVNLWNPFSLWVSAWSIHHKGIHWDWAMPNQENKEARWKRIKMQVQTFKRNGLAFKLDRNSYSYPIQSPRFGEVSGRKQATLLRQAGCNQGPRPWQPICSPSTSTLIPPLISFSTYFPSPHTFSPLLCFLM